MKILIADDDRVSLMMMRRMLVQSGYDVSTVCNGVDAVDSVIQENGPRLLLLDWMMPNLNGLEVCRAIRAHSHGRYVYIVLLTAKDSKADLITGLEAGADDFLTKPCHPEELQARLRAGHRILRLEDVLVEAREEMRFRATHDALTRLLNRGAIVQSLSDHLRDAKTLNPFAVVLCDIDHFKQINDTYGHPIGDEVLQAVATRLGGLRLRSDELGRFGGEEFMLLLHNVTPEGLDALGTNICDSICSTPIETTAGNLSVSVSAGILAMTGPGECLDVDEILTRTDQLLYQAKKEGRNRAVAGTYPDLLNAAPKPLLSNHLPPLLLLN